MRQRLPSSVRAAEIHAAMAQAAGDSRVAAQILGVSRRTFHARAARAGVRLVALRQDARTQWRLGEAALTDRGVTLALADYATLQTQAAMGREAARLESALDAAERVIVTLTRHVEDFGRRVAA